MPLTALEAQTQLDLWLAASQAIAQGQSYAIAGRTWTGTDVDKVMRMIDYWSGKVKELSDDADGGRSIRGVTPIINA